MKIAVEGCAHGELEKIYDTIASIEERDNIKIDLLICCGDFQSTRNLEDLQTMACPPKYLDMCTFYKYYSGEKRAPMLTIFIGGNHEASNYLQELPYGGWVAPNIYYLGYAGVVNVNGIRIGGLSGIHNNQSYLKGHHEFSPYNESTKRSVYHVRNLEVFRLKQLTGDIDVFISHDWPKGIYDYGNAEQLKRFKPFFAEEMDRGTLGSPPCEQLLKTLQPNMWFSAHLHCKFAALVPHENSEKITKFLALDKCLPQRRFLQVLELEPKDSPDDGEIKFEYDLQWLTILALTNNLLSTKNCTMYTPGPDEKFTPSEEELQHINSKFGNDLRIPENFCRTVEPYNPHETVSNPHQPKAQINPQTTQFCELLGIDDPVSLAMITNGHELNYSSALDDSGLNNSSVLIEEQVSINTSIEEPSPLKRKSLILPTPKLDESEHNPDEIALNDTDDEQLASSTPNEPPENEEQVATVKDDSDLVVKKFKRRNQTIYAENDE